MTPAISPPEFAVGLTFSLEAACHLDHFGFPLENTITHLRRLECDHREQSPDRGTRLRNPAGGRNFIFADERYFMLFRSLFLPVSNDHDRFRTRISVTSSSLVKCEQSSVVPPYVRRFLV